MAGQKSASSLLVEQPSLGVLSQCHGAHQVIWREHWGPIVVQSSKSSKGSISVLLGSQDRVQFNLKTFQMDAKYLLVQIPM
jgi:hypothetical protein